MWKPCGLIEELNPNLLFQKDVNIIFNILKIRKTKTDGILPDISNVKLINRDEISKFKTAKRCEEHATSRYLLYHMLAKYYPTLDLTSIEINRDKNRAPYLNWINGTFNSKPLPNFSISTSGELAIVALSNPEYVVGVDIEKLNEKRSEHLLEFLSNGYELEKIIEKNHIIKDNWINQLWTVKESLLKALRLGMSISPTKIEVLKDNLEFKPIVEYENDKLFLETSIIEFNENYSFSLAYRMTKKEEFETLSEADLEFKRKISTKLSQGQYDFKLGCETN